MLFAAFMHAVLGVISLARLFACATRIRKRLTEPPRKRRYQPVTALT
jgi:hypothetical protein